MGIADFFKKTFGKKQCAFCGGECGVMSRTKIKNDDYICSKCDDNCSKFIRKSRFTKDELLGHMEYIKRLDRIYKEVIEPSNERFDTYPGVITQEGITFYDSFGMFRVVNPSDDRKGRYPFELFRYDQVASWEPYIEEDDSSEPGKEKEFLECGIEITFVGAMDDKSQLRKGTKAHPYIIEPIRICFSKDSNEKERMLLYVENAIHHFNHIFGVHDDEKALFSFGMSKKEKRDLMANVAFAKTAIDAVKIAKNGGEISDEKKAEIQANMNAMDDAQTDGLAVYIRRADEAEAKIN